MNKKDNLLYFSIIFATLAMLASLNMQIKLIAMLFLIVAVFMLDSQDGFVLTIFSLCFLNNLQYWLNNNEKEIKRIADKAISARKAREAAKKARDNARNATKKKEKEEHSENKEQSENKEETIKNEKENN